MPVNRKAYQHELDQLFFGYPKFQVPPHEQCEAVRYLGAGGGR